MIKVRGQIVQLITVWGQLVQVITARGQLVQLITVWGQLVQVITSGVARYEMCAVNDVYSSVFCIFVCVHNHRRYDYLIPLYIQIRHTYIYIYIHTHMHKQNPYRSVVIRYPTMVTVVYGAGRLL